MRDWTGGKPSFSRWKRPSSRSEISGIRKSDQRSPSRSSTSSPNDPQFNAVKEIRGKSSRSTAKRLTFRRGSICPGTPKGGWRPFLDQGNEKIRIRKISFWESSSSDEILRSSSRNQGKSFFPGYQAGTFKEETAGKGLDGIIAFYLLKGIPGLKGGKPGSPRTGKDRHYHSGRRGAPISNGPGRHRGT